MISATEANEIVTKGKYDKAVKQMKEIEEKVEKAIAEGQTSASFDGVIDRANKYKLEELGYMVNQGSQYNESYFSVS